MKMRYFADTDTLKIEFGPAPVAGSRDLDEHAVVEVDSEGNICALTIAHVSERGGTPEFSFEQVSV